MKTDADLLEEVRGALAGFPRVDAGVERGVARVFGRVDTKACKHAVEAAVRHVADLHALVLEIDVQPSPQQQQRDFDIASAAAAALAAAGPLPSQALQIEIDNGQITLLGEVASAQQRALAEKAVQEVAGLRALHNHIRIAPNSVATADQLHGEDRPAP